MPQYQNTGKEGTAERQGEGKFSRAGGHQARTPRRRRKMRRGVERNEKGFASFVLVAGAHDHQKTRVWVHEDLVKKEKMTGNTGFESRLSAETLASLPEWEFVTFPVHSARITRTERGGLVLRPYVEGTVHLVEEESGYRGSCSLEFHGGEIIASGIAFHSPQGNLGETNWALINAQGPIRVTGRRTGRRVDREEIDYTLHTDGTVVEAEEEGLAQELA
jgi:hypothetical protein